MESGLPEDIVPDILCRLPIKSVLRFKLVSKSWCALIKTNKFCLEHFHHQGKCPHLILQNKHSPEYKKVCSLIPSSKIRQWYNKWFPRSVYADLSFLGFHGRSLQCFGPVNGCFLLLATVEWSRNHRMAMWNPATRQFRPLLEFKQLEYLHYFYMFGFGLDPQTKQFKVVWIRMTMTTATGTEPLDVSFAVFTAAESAESNLWRPLASNSSGISAIEFNNLKWGLNCQNIFLSGNNYWLSMDNLSILVFDMDIEVFREIKTPLDPNSPKGTQLYESDVYGTSNSQLGLVVLPSKISDPVEMWLLMKEDESHGWTKYVNVASDFLRVDYPLGYVKINGGGTYILRTTTSMLAMYNPETADVVYFGRRLANVFEFGSLSAFSYKESLFPIHGGFQISERILLDFADFHTPLGGCVSRSVSN